MADNSQGGGGLLGGYPISRSFAVLVLAALILLIALRHLTGTISISAS